MAEESCLKMDNCVGEKGARDGDPTEKQHLPRMSTQFAAGNFPFIYVSDQQAKDHLY